MSFFIIFFSLVFYNFSIFSNGYNDHAFITCQESNNLFVVDLEKAKVSKSFNLGTSPAAIFIDKIGGKVFVANPNSDNVSILDTKEDEVIEMDANKSPMGITYDTKKSLIYVTNWYDDIISVLSLGEKKILTTIRVGKSPAGIAFNQNLNLLAVANRDSNSVTLINGDDYNDSKTIQTEKSPFGVFFGPDGNLLAVTNVQSNSVSILDLNTQKIIKNIKVGEWPYQVAFNKKAQKIFVTNQREDSISIVNYNNFTHEEKISDICGYPEGVDNSNDLNSIIVSCWFDNEIIIMDLNTLKKKRISVCEGPRSFGNFIF